MSDEPHVKLSVRLPVGTAILLTSWCKATGATPDEVISTALERYIDIPEITAYTVYLANPGKDLKKG